MIVVLNGKEAEIVEGATMLMVLEGLELAPETVVVELNKDILPSDAFCDTVLRDGDRLEVLRFVGGG